MELQEPRHHASRLSGTRKLATYFIATLVLLAMVVWFAVISSLGGLSRYFIGCPLQVLLDVVLVALCFRLEGKPSNNPIAPLAALAGEAAKVGVLQTDVVGLEINDKHSCCRRGWIHRIAYVS